MNQAFTAEEEAVEEETVHDLGHVFKRKTLTLPTNSAMSSCCDMMKEPSKVWGSTDDRNTGLLNRNQVPDHLRFNKYVLNYYRPATDWMGCIKSLFYLHNETVNILTHGKTIFVLLTLFLVLLFSAHPLNTYCTYTKS